MGEEFSPSCHRFLRVCRNFKSSDSLVIKVLKPLDQEAVSMVAYGVVTIAVHWEQGEKKYNKVK